MNIMIILNYNDHETTLNYLDQIENYSILDKVIVVDNYSTDSSYSILKTRESWKIDIVQTDQNRGYATGNNFGIKYAERKYKPKNIIISNPDIIISEKSISSICDLLNSNEDVAAASGLIHDIKGDVVSNFAWRLPDYKDFIINSFLTVSKMYNKIARNSQFYNRKQVLNKCDILNAEVLSGCFFIIKYQVIKDIDYFDERTFLYNEENILSYKIKHIGLKQCILLSEKVTHLQGITIKKNIKNWNEKNKILFSSEKVYLINYLKVPKVKIFIYYILFNIGKYEKFAIINLKQKLMRGIK